jgi:hypothetical protein
MGTRRENQHHGNQYGWWAKPVFDKRAERSRPVDRRPVDRSCLSMDDLSRRGYERFTEIVVRDPETREERKMFIPDQRNGL